MPANVPTKANMALIDAKLTEMAENLQKQEFELGSLTTEIAKLTGRITLIEKNWE